MTCKHIAKTYASNFLAQETVTAARVNGSFDSRKMDGIFRHLSNEMSADLSSPSNQDASVLNRLAHQSVNESSQSERNERKSQFFKLI